MALSDITGQFIQKQGLIQAENPVDIITFLRAPWGLNKEIYPSQQFLLKLYYNLPLSDDIGENCIPVYDRFIEKKLFEFSEVGFLNYLYENGMCNANKNLKRKSNLLLPIGRRGTKTFMCSFIAAYEMYKLLFRRDPHAWYAVDPSTEITITNVATNAEQAKLLFDAVQGHLSSSPYFKPYLASSTRTHINLRTDADIDRYGPKGKSSLAIYFKPTIAKGLRGPANIVVILDEFAHFNEEGQSSDQEVYDAATPSVATFMDPKTREADGRIICISSPLNREGHFYHLYDLAMKGAEDWLVVQAPTWVMNHRVPSAWLRNKYKEDPGKFLCEFGAEFSDRYRGWIPDKADLEKCIVPTLRPKDFTLSRLPHYLGLDLGLKYDGTAIAISHLEKDGTYELDYIEAKYPNEENPELDFEEIVNWISELCKKFYIQKGIFDHYNGAVLAQRLELAGYRQFEMIHVTREIVSQMYQKFKVLMLDQKLRLFDWPRPSPAQHAAYLEELLELQTEQHSKYQVTVHAPNVIGKHDDSSDALVRSIWCASENLYSAVTAQNTAQEGKKKSRFAKYSYNFQHMKRLRQNNGFGTGRELVGRGAHRRIIK